MIKTPLSTVIGGAFWTPGATIIVGVPNTTPLMWMVDGSSLMWNPVDTTLMWQ